MSSARDALYDLADQDSQMENEPSKGLTKEDVSSAINDYFIQQQKSARQAEQMERQKKDLKHNVKWKSKNALKFLLL